MNNTKKLFVNTIILTAISFLMRTVGVSFNVYLSNKIGAAGIGLFELLMTVYALAVTVGAAGIRLATTRLVVEDAGRGGKGGDAVLRRCFLYGLLTGTMAALLLYFGAQAASLYWLQDVRALRPLRILALSLPFISMSAAFNGYFTARREIPQYAFVMLAEQAAKIGLAVLMLGTLRNPDMEKACVALAGSTSISEVFSFVLNCAIFFRRRRRQERPKSKGVLPWRALLRIAVPDAVGSSVRMGLLSVEHALIPLGFRKSGKSETQSLAIYGSLHGMVLPIILYPSAILSSLAGLLIPELAERNARQESARIVAVTERVLRMTLLFSLGTAGVLYAFADPLARAVYGDEATGQYIRVLAPLVPVMYLDMSVDGLLKGLDQQLQSMRYNIYDAAICVVLVYTLLPRYAVQGYIFILYVSELFNFYLSLGRLMHVTQLKVKPVSAFLKPLASIVLALLSVRVCFSVPASVLPARMQIIVFICASAGFYTLYLYLFGCLTRQDMQWVRRAVT